MVAYRKQADAEDMVSRDAHILNKVQQLGPGTKLATNPSDVGLGLKHIILQPQTYIGWVKLAACRVKDATCSGA